MAEAVAARRYPVGIQTFREIREQGYLYVDKTRYVYDLAHGSGKTYFLSRPRRFGKSLLLSTMQAYFEGRRELFEGLAVSELETEWEGFPVIRIDLSSVKCEDVQVLELLLDRVLRKLEEVWGRDEADVTPGSRLYSLIGAAYRRTGKPVVLLVDEYDAPLLNVAHDPERLHAFRLTMREFYACIKANDDILRFVMLTGITKFSQLSIFSELNNLTNISMDERFAGICGITQEELRGQMAADVGAFATRLGVSWDEALAELKSNYDGYHFCSQSPDIYNPFSLLSALAKGELDSYWFGSGTPTFLVNLLDSKGWDLASVEGCVARATSFDAPAERLDTPLPMLYQGGYLTIKSYDARRRAYTLGIPNEEVRRGLCESLVQHAAPEALMEHYGFLDRLADCLNEGDLDGALGRIRSYLAGIPYHLGSRDERGFQTKFFLILDLLGVQVDTEFKTATGRVDCVVKTDDAIYVFEFKYNRCAAEALAQIDERGYMLPFEADGRKLYKVGVNFSEDTQTIEEWAIREA